MRTDSRLRRSLLVAAAVALAACGGGEDDATVSRTIVEPTLAPGDDLPAVDDPVFVLDAPAGELVFDVATFERLGVDEATAFEPWFERDVTFAGVWASDLLDYAGADGGDDLWLHALDDYAIELDVADLDPGDALFATRADGAPIDVADGGPIRLVFVDPDGVGRNSDFWIWNLDAGAIG